jgi:penicillin-binding protein 2
MQKNIFSIGDKAAPQLNNKKYRHHWVEDSYIPEQRSPDYLSVNINFAKFTGLLVFALICFGVLFFRTAFLQIVQGQNYRQASESNRLRIEDIKAPRGTITDRNGVVLTDNVPNFVLSATPADLPKNENERNAIVKKISDITKLTIADITRSIEDQKTILTNSLPNSEADQIKRAEKNLPGVNISNVSGQNYTLTVMPSDWPKDETERTALVQQISDLSHISPAIIIQSIRDQAYASYQAVTIAEHLPYDQAMLLRVATAEMPGVNLSSSTFRNYISDQTFSSLLGYVGKVSDQDLKNHDDYARDDYIGKTGLELYYESDLRGQSGKKEVEVDSLGKESKIIAETKPVSGTNITLSIDSKLQSVLGQALDDAVRKSKNITGGAAVAIDPRNGEILALVSSPAFDNNAFTLGLSTEEYQKISSDPKQPLFNRPISGQYPSGSTIKPLIALAGLQEGVISENTSIMSSGGIRIGEWFFPDWKAGGHGATDVKKALAESVNTFFYTVGGGYEKFTGLGVNRITQYLKLFGLGQPLGLDFPTEASGFLPSPEWKLETKKEKWYIGDTYHYSIGQGDLLVTPLQVATYTATVANGGTFYKPHLVKAFTDLNGETTKTTVPEIIRQNFLSAYNVQIVRAGLRQAVTAGSGRMLGDLPFAVAAKTGTAEFGDIGSTHAWLTAFAPYDDPQIAITVLVEAGGEGNAVALPIAKLGLQTWYNGQLAQ